ncbi:hypothetical protein Acr_16g0001450 [Actinidia rufa]|uniref:Uncharacterized protein n=1 Tax=Actinidia rufa TaxID=165716 RepID=A0A7J0FXV1_9ERIC|nr:hypothetical protein Acr_16g0001450 [Actinidia rufa]
MNNDAPNQREPMEIPAEKQLGLSPVWRVSPKHNGSTLYDSFELQAVTKQLNKALQGSNGPLSPYSLYLKSPYYRQRLDRIYKKNMKKPKSITSRRVESAKVDEKAGARGNGGFVARLWMKVKRGLLWNNKRQEG